MDILPRDSFAALLKNNRISKRLVRDLRYVPEEISHVSSRDFLAITVKSGGEGVLLFESNVYPFELRRRGPRAASRAYTARSPDRTVAPSP